MEARVTVPSVLPEPLRHRPYTGSVEYAAGLLSSARLQLHLELCGLERRLWTEDLAGKHVIDALPGIRKHLDDMQRIVREIETTLTTVEEEQANAKEVISRDAA